jgi:uncharacterized integral membrane protein
MTCFFFVQLKLRDFYILVLFFKNTVIVFYEDKTKIMACSLAILKIILPLASHTAKRNMIEPS